MMREYGQIQCAFWSDPDVQSLSDNAKLLFTYLLTGPHSNGLGCYRIPDGYVQADFGWPPATVSKGFAELSDKGFIKRCQETAFVVILKYLKWNPVSNGNVAMARVKEFDTIPKRASIFPCLINELLIHGKHFPEPFANRLETLAKRFAEGYAEQDPTLPNPTQPRPDPTHTSSAARTATGKADDEGEAIERIFKHWQTTYNHPKAVLEQKRRKLIRARLKDYTEADLCQAITGYQNSPHHMGTDPKGNGTVYDSIELFLRDAKHVDMGLRFYRQPPARASGLTRANIASTDDWEPPEVRRMRRNEHG